MRKRKHSPEFREQAVKQTLTGDESIKDIAAALGIRYWTLQEWRRQYLESQKKEPETRKKSSAEEELKRLKAENASLRMDNTKVCSRAFPGRWKKFAFMKPWRKGFSMNLMAALLGVSKSGFYSYLNRSGKKKEIVSSDLLSMITRIHRSNIWVISRRRNLNLRKWPDGVSEKSGTFHNTGAGMKANSSIYDDEKGFNISDSGKHEAIIVKLGGQDVVFDNNHPNGKTKTEWESVLQTPARITYRLSFEQAFNPKKIDL